MTEVAIPPISEQEASSYRAEFPIFEHTTYLNSCSLGPLGRRAEAGLAKYRETWSAYGAPAWWKVWLPTLAAARDRFAQLIGAQPHEVTISHSISSALSSIASTFDYRTRSKVLCAELDFPTIPYQWLTKRREGVTVRLARSSDRIRMPLREYASNLDSATALVATSHVFYATGAIQPIRHLADLAHSHGAKIIVDGYHAVGAIPVDVKALDVDCYVGGTLKWLLGGPGLTFIYVRDELIPQLQPTISGWFASADQFAFDAERLNLAPSADRLELGTPAVATAYAGVHAMGLIQEVNPLRIYPRLQELTTRIIERARDAGYNARSPRDPGERAGIVMLEMPKPQETVAELARRGFTVDYRPDLVRISPHFFNTLDDIDRAMDAVIEVQNHLP